MSKSVMIMGKLPKEDALTEFEKIGVISTKKAAMASQGIGLGVDREA